MAPSKKLELNGNLDTMNLNNLLYQNIISSPYFKQLYEKKTYHEILDEIYNHVTSLVPFLRGTVASTAFCLLFKLHTLRPTIKQIMGMLNYDGSPHIRAMGFLYLRFATKPGDLWDWYYDYLDDEELVQIEDGVRPRSITIGQLVRDLLVDAKFLGTMLPRIPVLMAREIATKLKEYGMADRIGSTETVAGKVKADGYNPFGGGRVGGLPGRSGSEAPRGDHGSKEKVGSSGPGGGGRISSREPSYDDNGSGRYKYSDSRSNGYREEERGYVHEDDDYYDSRRRSSGRSRGGSRDRSDISRNGHGYDSSSRRDMYELEPPRIERGGYRDDRDRYRGRSSSRSTRHRDYSRSRSRSRDRHPRRGDERDHGRRGSSRDKRRGSRTRSRSKGRGRDRDRSRDRYRDGHVSRRRSRSYDKYSRRRSRSRSRSMERKVNHGSSRLSRDNSKDRRRERDERSKKGIIENNNHHSEHNDGEIEMGEIK